MSLSIEVAGKTDVGCVRHNNEDNFGYDAHCGIFVVCDGMGGMAAGEVASKIAVDTILAYFRETKNGHFPAVGKNFDNVSDRANALAGAIQRANEAVHEAAQADPSRAGMGSTVVAVLMQDGVCAIGHVGDSRIYLVRNGNIQQLTSDHSLVMEQVRRGLITLDEARDSEMQNIIIRALGSEPTVEPDVEDLNATSGDLLLLCSDGLTRHLSDQKLLEIVSRTPALQESCDQLIQAAKDAGGDDNITCLLVRLVDPPWYRRFLPGTSLTSQNSI